MRVRVDRSIDRSVPYFPTLIMPPRRTARPTTRTLWTRAGPALAPAEVGCLVGSASGRSASVRSCWGMRKKGRGKGRAC